MTRSAWTANAWQDAEEQLDGHVGLYHAKSRIERDLLSGVVCSDIAPCGEEVGECVCCEIHPRPVVIAFDGYDWGNDTVILPSGRRIDLADREAVRREFAALFGGSVEGAQDLTLGKVTKWPDGAEMRRQDALYAAGLALADSTATDDGDDQ